jgi:hypothetical protein
LLLAHHIYGGDSLFVAKIGSQWAALGLPDDGMKWINGVLSDAQ